jgi:hypothetical protein
MELIHWRTCLVVQGDRPWTRLYFWRSLHTGVHAWALGDMPSIRLPLYGTDTLEKMYSWSWTPGCTPIIADLCSSSDDHGSRDTSSRQQCRLLYIYATTNR